MALKSTIFKATVQISDMDRHYYAEHLLTLARHPSETDERLMVRLAAFILNADPALEFGKGISTDDEPALWRKDLTGAIEQWIEVGLPDERRVRKACGRANAVLVYVYGGRAAELWWQQNASALRKLDSVRVLMMPPETCEELTALAERTMQLQCTIQDGECWLSDGVGEAMRVVPVDLKAG